MKTQHESAHWHRSRRQRFSSYNNGTQATNKHRQSSSCWTPSSRMDTRDCDHWGVIQIPGNISPFAEFNNYNDPEATSLVLSSGIPAKLITLDVCNKTYITRSDMRWLHPKSKNGRLTSRILGNWFRNQSHYDHVKLEMCMYAHLQQIVDLDFNTSYTYCWLF